MAFCCGFECGGVHVTLGAGSSISTTTVRTGNRSLALTNPNANRASFGVGVSSAFSVSRFYIRFSSLPNVSCSLFSAYAGTFVGVVFNSADSKIYAGYSDGNFGATGVSVTTGIWYRIDTKIDFTNNPWTIDVSVDGVACGQKTFAAAGTTASQHDFGPISANVTGTWYYDDLVITHNSANFPLGPGRVDHFVPTADGTHNIAGTADFRRTLTTTDILNATTTAYQLVDDVPMDSGTGTDFISMIAPPNATDYVELRIGPAPGVSTPTTGPRVVHALAAMHQAGTGAGNMRVWVRDNASTADIYTATGVAGVTTIFYALVDITDPPSAASVWHALNDASNGDFRNLRVRFGSPAALDVNPDQYLDSVMVEAEFAEASSALIGSLNLLFAGTSTIAGAGALLGASPVAFAPTATIKGDLPAIGSTTFAFTPTSQIQGSGLFAGVSTVVFAPAGTIMGDLPAFGYSAFAFAPVGLIVGNTDLAGVSSFLFSTGSTIQGAGELLATSSWAFVLDGLLDNLPFMHNLAGVASLLFAPAGLIQGSGLIVGQSSPVFSGTGLIIGDALGIGQASIVFSPVGNIAASGELIGQLAAAFAVSSDIVGIADIIGASGMQFIAASELLGLAQLDGVASFVFSGDSAMEALAGIFGAANVSFTPQGLIQGDGSLAGGSVVVFNVNGVPVFVGLPRRVIIIT